MRNSTTFIALIWFALQPAFAAAPKDTCIAVEWGGESAATFPVELLIRTKDRPGLLAEITAVISNAGSNIRMLDSRPDRQNARIEASLEITDKRQLENILASIRRINGVFGVERIYQI